MKEKGLCWTAVLSSDKTSKKKVWFLLFWWKCEVVQVVNTRLLMSFCDTGAVKASTSWAVKASTSILATRWHHHLGSVLYPLCISVHNTHPGVFISLPSYFTGHCPKKRIYMRMVKSAVIMDWSDHVSKYLFDLVSYILKWHCWHCAEPAVSLPPFVLSKCSLVWFHLFGSIKPVVVQHLKSLHSTIYPMCPNKDHGTSWVCPLT